MLMSEWVSELVSEWLSERVNSTFKFHLKQESFRKRKLRINDDDVDLMNQQLNDT